MQIYLNALLCLLKTGKWNEMSVRIVFVLSFYLNYTPSVRFLDNAYVKKPFALFLCHAPLLALFIASIELI